MNFVIGILTFILVINSGLLILLVLVQLPKKDAGAGMAFGAGTADALFGAGSGNLLTNITGWAAGILLVLCLFLGMLQSRAHTDNTGSDFTKLVEQKQQQAPAGSLAPLPKPQATLPAANPSFPATVPASATNVTAPSVKATTPTSTNAEKAEK